jgi:histidinol-phosphate aminotransferase
MSLSRRQLLTSAALLMAAPRGAFAASVARPGGAAADPTAEHPYLMHWNENPYGPSPAARESIARAVARTQRYVPFDEEDALLDALAAHEGVTRQQIVTGTGSGELLRALGLWAAREGGEVVTADPTYDDLIDSARLHGARIVSVPLDGSFQHDLDAMLAAVNPQTRIVYVCNPHNPTGTAHGAARLARFLTALPPHVTAVVDEAYLEFADAADVKSVAPLIRSGLNLVVVRTFSKIHGMAGVRLGYAIAPEKLAKAVAPLRMTWLNVFAPAAVLASLGDTAYLADTRRRILAGRSKITAQLRLLGMPYADPQGNFVFFDTGMPHAEFAAAMKAEHVIVGRPFPPYANWCRVTVGTEIETDWFLRVLRKIRG